DTDQAVLAEGCVVDIVHAGDRPGMRGCRLDARGGASELEHDDGLLAFGCFTRQIEQLRTVFDALDRHQHYAGRIRAQHEAGEIERVEIGLVADARLVADAQTDIHRSPHHADLTEAAAVADDADITCGRPGAGNGRGGGHGKAVD